LNTSLPGVRRSRPGIRFVLKKALALVGTSVISASTFAAFTAPVEAQAKVIPGASVIQVEGPLGNVESAGLVLTPAFAQNITDYVFRCQAGANPTQVTLTASTGKINVNGNVAKSVVLQESLVENQALVIISHGPKNPAGTQYWVRCLPHDFPQLAVDRPGSPPAGWYLTGDITAATPGAATYAMVLDSHGTPVWYRQTSSPGAINTTLLQDGTLAWIGFVGPGFGIDPHGAYEDFNLVTRQTRFISTPIPPTDLHEIHPMANGDLILIATPLRANVDLTSRHLSSSATIVDCLIQEINPAGQLVWSWRASDHIDMRESTSTFPSTVHGQLVYDPIHCNSVDVDPSTGNVLVSTRNTDGVYLINKATGTIIWKLSGVAPNHDGAQILTIVGDPYNGLSNQHDARFEPNGDVSVYDDESSRSALTARGVEYHIDAVAGTATLVWSFKSPDGHNSAATGSFRRLFAGSDNVIAWGVKPHELFTEVDGAGNILMHVTLPNGEPAYRVQKVPTSALNHDLLRTTAGLPPFVRTFTPAVSFVGPASGPATGGTTVLIVGSGFRGATAVRFGSQAATAFTVVSDSLITATAPAGIGTTNVTVTGPSGTSSVNSMDQLQASASDASFESGTGSWVNAGNSTIALGTTNARSGAFSLQVSPIAPGAFSAITGKYAVVPGAQVNGALWILTPSGATTANATLTFYNSANAVIATVSGSAVTSSASSWTSISVAGMAPSGAAWVAIGFSDAGSSGAIFVDDASLTGSTQYAFI
jgi:Arylsulfotransferase (ASST)/IPT/TIG domain